MKFFTTEGPLKPEDHFCLPQLERLKSNEIIELIDPKKYFLIHAPRQTGKTTCLLALTDYLNTEGKYRALPTTSREFRRQGRMSRTGDIYGGAGYRLMGNGRISITAEKEYYKDVLKQVELKTGIRIVIHEGVSDRKVSRYYHPFLQATSPQS